MKASDYVKLEQMKALLLSRVKQYGIEELDYINDEDILKLLSVMFSIGTALGEIEDGVNRETMLLDYIQKLVVILIVRYGAKLDMF